MAQLIREVRSINFVETFLQVSINTFCKLDRFTTTEIKVDNSKTVQRSEKTIEIKFPVLRLMRFGSASFRRKPFGRLTFGRLTFGWLTFGRLTFGRLTFGRLAHLEKTSRLPTVDRMAESTKCCFYQMPVDEMSFDRKTCNLTVMEYFLQKKDKKDLPWLWRTGVEVSKNSFLERKRKWKLWKWNWKKNSIS